MHGFDEFFGNLYHLNATEVPENEDYPKNPEFKKKYDPRGGPTRIGELTSTRCRGGPPRLQIEPVGSERHQDPS
jgi:hypothetical protein